MRISWHSWRVAILSGETLYANLSKVWHITMNRTGRAWAEMIAARHLVPTRRQKTLFWSSLAMG